MNKISLWPKILQVIIVIECFMLTSQGGLKAQVAPLENSTSKATDTPPPKELKDIDQEEALNIYRHRPIYLISGAPDTKVQLSFKLMPVFRFPLYFAYTQLMFWELGKESKPFQDINYNPELFYLWTFDHAWLNTLSVGIEHRSNGKDYVDSRSLDQAFIAITNQIGYGSYRLSVAARFYWAYDIDWQTNGNIRKFSGVTSARVSLDGVTERIFPTKGEIYIDIHPGGSDSLLHGHGAMEFTVKYRLGLSDVMPYLMFQYYYGYMESLLKYDQLTHSYRIGLSF